jgi:PAS domain S-box-containing protein
MAAGDLAFFDAAQEIIAALDNVPSPTALLDEAGTIRWQNKASVALRGSRVGRNFADFVAPGDRDRARAVFARMLSRGDPEELGVRGVDAHGDYVSLHGRWSVVPFRGGGKVVVVLSLGDVSDLPDPGHVGLLTPRQLDVLRLLAAGRSTKEIATALSLSPTSVRNHVANMLSALGVHSRLQAVVVARAARLIDG